MGYSDAFNTEKIYFEENLKIKYQWRCKQCGIKNIAENKQDCFCKKCKFKFEAEKQTADIYNNKMVFNYGFF